MNWDALLFLALWTAMAAGFAWLGYNRLEAAKSSGRFEYLWHGVSRTEWPAVFRFLSGFLTIWTGLAALLTAIGVMWLIWSLWEKIS